MPATPPVMPDHHPTTTPVQLKKKYAIVAALAGALAAQIAAVATTSVVVLVLAFWRGTEPHSMQALLESPLVLVLSSPATSLSLLAVACFTPLFARVPLERALGLSWPRGRTWPLALAAVPGVGSIGELLAQGLKAVAPDFTWGTLDVLTATIRELPLWLLIPTLALLPGVCEEAFFRGMLQRAFGHSWAALLGVSAVFSLYHLDPQHVVATFPIGLYLGWLAMRTGSTLLPMGVHVFNNALALVATRLTPDEPIGGDTLGAWAIVPVRVGIAAIVRLHAMTRSAP